MDALAVSVLCRELKPALLLGRIDKVHQPADRELVLTIRTRAAGTVRLRLSAV
ncbi:MAG: NFACT family protein, partial [Alicyclobacillus sp.]|nr:NFACT family protein [Alicyclobacillus sp.]